MSGILYALTRSRHHTCWQVYYEGFARLSADIRIYTGKDDHLGGTFSNTTAPLAYRMPVRTFVHVKNHVIMGANTVVLPGIIISEGVAVGANSVIKSDCDPWTIYAEAPAKPIEERPKGKILELER
jgi:acetyltransferase-like isoleucine patch superfamily enzyme